MLRIHPCARATPAVRAEIARSTEPTGVLARRHGVSAETVRKWRRRGPDDCRDRSPRPHRLPWRGTEDERAIVCEVRRATRFPLDDLTAVIQHFLPHLNRDSVYRILRAEGLARPGDPPPLYPDERPRKGAGRFKAYDLGFVHLDIRHLPKLRTADGVVRRRYLFLAIDRCSRAVHLAVKDAATQANAVAFLKEARAAFPFRITRVLTDRGSSFKAVFGAACREPGIEHRKTRPDTPQTNGMAERFNGRSEREVLTITVGGHQELEHLLAGYNQAYNARRQRVLAGRSPGDVVRERLGANPGLANPDHHAPDRAALRHALTVIDIAKEVSQPDI